MQLKRKEAVIQKQADCILCDDKDGGIQHESTLEY